MRGERDEWREGGKERDRYRETETEGEGVAGGGGVSGKQDQGTAWADLSRLEPRLDSFWQQHLKNMDFMKPRAWSRTR